MDHNISYESFYIFIIINYTPHTFFKYVVILKLIFDGGADSSAFLYLFE